MNNKDNQAGNEEQLVSQNGIELTGSPEEFGVPPASTSLEKSRVWDRQELFLSAYRQTGKQGRAADSVGMNRSAVNKWQQGDVFSFRERIKAAHQDYCECLEQMMDDRLANPQGNRGSDVLLMFKMKAEDPAKFRETVEVVDTRETKDLLDELRRIGSPRTVEGQPKTLRSRRSISLSPAAVELLHGQIRGTQMEHQLDYGALWRNTGYVFTQLGGSPIDPDRVSK